MKKKRVFINLNLDIIEKYKQQQWYLRNPFSFVCVLILKDFGEKKWKKRKKRKKRKKWKNERRVIFNLFFFKWKKERSKRKRKRKFLFFFSLIFSFSLMDGCLKEEENFHKKTSKDHTQQKHVCTFRLLFPLSFFCWEFPFELDFNFRNEKI